MAPCTPTALKAGPKDCSKIRIYPTLCFQGPRQGRFQKPHVYTVILDPYFTRQSMFNTSLPPAACGKRAQATSRRPCLLGGPGYLSSVLHIYHITTIPGVIVYEVSQELHHQQYHLLRTCTSQPDISKPTLLTETKRG